MTTINISPEAVEHLCAIHEGYEQHGTVATLRALSAALTKAQADLAKATAWAKEHHRAADRYAAAMTQSRAETAAAYERAAMVLDGEAAVLEADASRFRSGTDPHHYRMNFAAAARKQSATIRAIATPDQTAALDKLIAEAVNPYLEAMRYYETQFCEGFCEDMPDRSVTNEGMENDCSGCKARAILAASKKGGV